MQKLLLCAIIFLTATSLHAQQLYNQTIIGSNSEENNPIILELPDHSYLIAITTSGGQTGMKTTANFGGSDCWILRYDANDQLMWQKNFGGDKNEFVTNMVLSQDNQVLLICESYSGISGNKTVENVGTSDIWLLKLDIDGNIIWQKNYGTSSYDSCKTILAHPDQSIYLGLSCDTADVYFTDEVYGLVDMMVLKLDAQGNKIWDHSYGTNSYDQLESLALEPYTNKVVVFGNINVAGTGNMTLTSSVQGTNCWVFKLDANGEITDQTCFGAGTQSGTVKTTYLSDGSCWVMVGTQSDIEGEQTLNHFGMIDTWLVHLDANLQIIGQRIFGGTLFDNPQSISYDGQIVEIQIISNSPASGNKLGDCQGFSDLWYLQLNAIDGEILFQKTIGGDQPEYYSALLRKGTDVRFFIQSNSPVSGDKEVSNVNFSNDIWCVTMGSTLGLNQQPLNPKGYSFSIEQNVPNPFSDRTSIRFQLAPGVESATLSIFNLNGAFVRDYQLNGNTGEVEILASEIGKGMYIYSLNQNGQEIISKRMIIK